MPMLGRARAEVVPQTRALEMANGAPGNTQIVILALKNRSRAASGWHHDSVKLEHSGPEGGQLSEEPRQVLDISALSWEQRDQLEQILSRSGRRRGNDRRAGGVMSAYAPTAAQERTFQN
jgi:hypothetical protein